MTNRLKGLNLIDRMPEELWMEVHNTEQETVTKTIPKKKKSKKAKWLSEEALQIAEKRQRRKGKIYPTKCRAQSIARRDKKAFLSEQSKEIEENSIMGKTRNIFKKIRDSKGTFHAKKGTI